MLKKIRTTEAHISKGCAILIFFGFCQQSSPLTWRTGKEIIKNSNYELTQIDGERCSFHVVVLV